MWPACNSQISSTIIKGIKRIRPRCLLSSTNNSHGQPQLRRIHFNSSQPLLSRPKHEHLDFLLPSFAGQKGARKYRPPGAPGSSRNFWGRSDNDSSQRASKNTSSSYLDPSADSPILGRSFTLQNHGDVMLKCTEFDHEGQVRAEASQFKKSELCTMHGLLPRDLRKIESSVIVPHILVRKNSILVNLLHIRAIIKSDAFLLFDVYGSEASQAQNTFVYDLVGKLCSGASTAMGGLPYEMRALESILISVTSALEKEVKVLEAEVVKVLAELDEDIDREKLRVLLIYSKKLSTFEQKAKLIRGAIDEILEADDDLASMYLTDKSKGIERPASEHSEVEMLLESYYKITDECVQISENLLGHIRNTEDIVNIILDANRNSLMLLDLKFSIGTLGIGSGAFIAGLFGMNLTSTWEESDVAFLGVTAGSAFVGTMILIYGLIKLHRTQRTSMWGGGGKGRKWWGRAPPARNHELSTSAIQQRVLEFHQTLHNARLNGRQNMPPPATRALEVIKESKS